MITQTEGIRARQVDRNGRTTKIHERVNMHLEIHRDVATFEIYTEVGWSNQRLEVAFSRAEARAFLKKALAHLDDVDFYDEREKATRCPGCHAVKMEDEDGFPHYDGCGTPGWHVYQWKVDKKGSK